MQQSAWCSWLQQVILILLIFEFYETRVHESQIRIFIYLCFILWQLVWSKIIFTNKMKGLSSRENKCLLSAHWHHVRFFFFFLNECKVVRSEKKNRNLEPCLMFPKYETSLWWKIRYFLLLYLKPPRYF